MDDSSEDEVPYSSGQSVNMSDESEETAEDDDNDDPDYEVDFDDDDNTEMTEPQFSPASVHSPAASADNNDEPRELNAEASRPVGHSAAHDMPAEQNAELSRPIVPIIHIDSPERPIVASQRGSDEDGQICTICFEPWTNSSEHRLVSLRCGHLFGRSCITRWLKGQNARCPQCNARARKSEIRNIYAKAVKVLDSSERDKALQDLARESELRRAAEITAAQERVKHMMAVQECERLKKELIDTQRQLQEYRSGLKSIGSSQSAKSSSSVFSLAHHLDIAKDGGCRIVDSSTVLNTILVSQPSSNKLFPGYGFRKISTFDMRLSEFVYVHQKPIKDMRFHLQDGLVLTASLDKSLRITNILTNSVVQTYNVGADAWSCAWDSDNSVYFYGGLKTGEVYVFDIRVTNRYVYELPKFGAKTPVVSLQYLHNPLSASHRNSGPLVGKLSDGALHQKTERDGQFKVVPMPALGTFTCLSADSSGHFLISCRPTTKQPRVTHTLCDYVTSASGELVCSPLKTFIGGRNQVQLTRSKLLSHPEKGSSLLVCAGDEDARGVLVWDGSSGNCIDNLRTDDPALDISGLHVNSKFYLTALTDKSLRIYNWNGL